ncbi:MAG: SRPBCC domain-containing protein [Flavobacterium sp.]
MITVQTTINATLSHVWDCFTKPEHIVHWNFASDDWHCPTATSDFKEEGNFSYTMSAKDSTTQFNLKGTFLQIEKEQLIVYQLEDNRKVNISFNVEEDAVKLVESFEPENIHSHDLQREGWQAILNNFKKYCEQ